MKKTPDEIKKGLKACARDLNCNSCPYKGFRCTSLLMQDADDALRQLEAKVPKWISVKERLPRGECLAINDRGVMLIGYVGENDLSETGYICDSDGIWLTSVTHWMPLPEPPVEV